MAEPQSGWAEQGQMFEGQGDVGGDVQAGTYTFDRRFVKLAEPGGKAGAVITVTFYPVYGRGEDPMNNGLENGPFSVQRMTEYAVCKDVTDPGGGGGFADIRYDLADGPFATVEEAENVAGVLCRDFDPAWIVWDGESTDVANGIVEPL